MFGLFKKKSEYEKLEEKYKALLKEAFELSTINRSKSDLKQAEAEEIWKQMENMIRNKK
jgi:TRAP-type mannitol/chloroaromatic compound transport system substrate-binding protein